MDKFPIFHTQNGGGVRPVGLCSYVFVKKPDCPGFDVGDYMPNNWSIAPANDLAKNYVDSDELGVD